MESRNQTKQNYDRLSRWYDAMSGNSEKPARTRGWQLLAIQPNERVLEIGCGTGEALIARSSSQTFGVDLSRGMLTVARRKLKSQANLIQSDALRLPFPNRSMDVVFMSFTLELFPAREIPIVLDECKRVLKADGRVGIVSLLQNYHPRAMEKIYVRAHSRWPAVIDCAPIPLFEILREARYEIVRREERSMFGLTVGIAVARNLSVSVV